MEDLRKTSLRDCWQNRNIEAVYLREYVFIHKRKVYSRANTSVVQTA
jgi:hypothetical protein